MSSKMKSSEEMLKKIAPSVREAVEILEELLGSIFRKAVEGGYSSEEASAITSFSVWGLCGNFINQMEEEIKSEDLGGVSNEERIREKKCETEEKNSEK